MYVGWRGRRLLGDMQYSRPGFREGEGRVRAGLLRSAVKMTLLPGVGEVIPIQRRGLLGALA